jgi:predicted O-methyltransferase YrrM
MALIRKLLHYHQGGKWSYIVWFFALFLIPCAIIKIKLLNKRYSLDELVNITFTMCFGLIEPAQVRYEILELLKVLDKIKPKTILEIGTLEGGTLFLFTRVASKNATIISVDLPPAKFLFKLRAPLYRTFISKNQQLCLIKEDSHDKITLEKVKNILNGKKVDFLFIDGDHSYEGVKKDFEMYSSLVEPNGIIAFHDILSQPDSGVDKFWDEIKPQYKYIEIKDEKEQHKLGIGLIKLN